MKRLTKAARDYVELRRSLGYKMRWVPGHLSNFISFLKEQKATHITSAFALQWAQLNNVQPVTAARHLTDLRGFAAYCKAIDPRHEIPPKKAFPHQAKRARPYLYTDDEIASLLRAAKEIGGLHGHTYYHLFGLLAVTGLRISEAVNLRRQDVRLDEQMLVIVGTKCGKSRLVPIHSSTRRALVQYARTRDRFFRRDVPTFFVTERGNRIIPNTARNIFHRLSRKIGIRDPRASHGPRLHDFRHRFAVQTLVNWYRTGEQIEQRLPVLSTYLGHRNVSDTYWYITACPELMGLAIKRFERRWEEAR
jgi:integrase/recombinase XerD